MYIRNVIELQYFSQVGIGRQIYVTYTCANICKRFRHDMIYVGESDMNSIWVGDDNNINNLFVRYKKIIL